MFIKKMIVVPAMAAFMVGGTGVFNAAMAANTCGPQTISYSGNQDPDDDEFLYRTKSEFDASQAGYENSNHTNSGSGHGYECDNKHCNNSSTVTLDPGHVFKGKVVPYSETYQCDTESSFNDFWAPLKKSICSAGRTYGDLSVGKCYASGGDCVRLTKEQCSNFELTDQNGVEFILICREGPQTICKAVKCPENYKLNSDSGKCIVDTEPKCDFGPKYGGRVGIGKQYKHVLNYSECKEAGFEVTDAKGVDFDLICRSGPKAVCKARGCPSGYVYEPSAGKCLDPNNPDNNDGGNDGGNGGGNGSNCKASRSSLEGKACCDLAKSVAEWKAPNCVCVDKNKEFRIVNGKGKCVTKSTPVVADKCDCKKTEAERAMLRLKCVKNKEVMSLLDRVDAECKKPEAECSGSVFTVYMDDIREQAQLPNCGVITIIEEPTVNAARITSTIKSIDDRVSKLDSSVWKTAEGNFNGARLASDSIAGVVLGTAGGLITSSVVKKNQVKSGFEDIVCTVGGQVVGSYGDEIRVGIQ